MTDIRIFTDLEYAYPGMQHGQPRPGPDKQRVILEVGAIQYDWSADLEEDEFHAFVLPPKHILPFIPKFWTELTHHSAETVLSQGRPFLDVMRDFVRFCGKHPVYTFNADYGVWQQNCGYHGVEFPLKRQFTRVKEELPRHGLTPEDWNSGTLYRAAGIQMHPSQGQEHDAMFDVRSMAYGWRALCLRGPQAMSG